MLTVLLDALIKVLFYGIILLLGFWCWFQFTHWKILRAAAKLPSPLHPQPIIGHAHLFLYGFENLTRLILEECDDMISKGWTACCLWVGPLPLIVLFGIEDIERVLNMPSTSEKMVEYDFAKFALGHGLLTAPWNVWKVSRRHINPLFHPHNLEHMIPTFNRNSRELATVLSEHVGAKHVNIFPHSMDTALQSVCHLIFGTDVDFNKKSELFQGLREVVERIPQILMTRLFKIWLRIESVFNFFYKRELQEINKMWRKFTEEPLKIATIRHADKIKNIEIALSQTDVTEDSIKINSKDMLNFLDVYKILQKNHPNFSDRDLEAEMITLYAAGTDTVGQVTASCLLALAYYPSMQERVFQEIMSVVGQDDDVTSHELLRMPYLDQVYKESLRFFMIVPFIGRRTTEDIQLGSHFIPAGCALLLALEALNMNPKVFPNPKTFDPENFSQESIEGREKYSFIPYSGGPRSCIGKRYAEILMKIMVVHVLRRYKLTTKMNIYKMKKKLSVTLVCTEGYHIALEPRY